MERIQINTLKLKGITKDYEYSFAPGLNIITGPISTGKTSILEFIDYCFGARAHPEHIEIQKKVRSVLLECEVAGDVLVIERPLFTSARKAIIHECSIANLDKEHTSQLVQARQIKGQESISSYLLKKLGSFQLLLKEAPTKDASDVDMMSFRDLMWFCFMPHARLDNKQLLFENVPMKLIKLHQVFDVIFKMHANELGQLSLQIKSMENELTSLSGEIKTLIGFLNERRVPSRDNLEERLQSLSRSESELADRLRTITETLKGESDVAQQLREQLSKVDDEIRQLLVVKRDREKLLKRLLPLRGQYSEDIKKLQFLQEAKTIFDPLGLIRCPYCLELIDKKEAGYCNLCGRSMKAKPSASFDIKKEIRTIETKLRELNQFVHETDKEVDEIKSQLDDKNLDSRNIRSRLDEAMKEYVSPYVSERDSVVGELNRVRQQIQDIGNQLNLHKGIETRIDTRNKVEGNLKQKEEELETERLKVKNREELIEKVSERFGEILKTASFPKLENPLIDSNLVPHVRGLGYRKIGSGGATTLLSLSWFLSIFENAIEYDGSHPGFVLIDSPQKNIGMREEVEEDEFRDAKIIEGLYHHIIEKASEYDGNAQWIIVDNVPPQIADKFIAVRFTRNKDNPPYGLIDDETD